MVHTCCIHVKNIFGNNLNFLSDRTFQQHVLFLKTEDSIVKISSKQYFLFYFSNMNYYILRIEIGLTFGFISQMIPILMIYYCYL